MVGSLFSLKLTVCSLVLIDGIKVQGDAWATTNYRDSLLFVLIYRWLRWTEEQSQKHRFSVGQFIQYYTNYIILSEKWSKE